MSSVVNLSQYFALFVSIRSTVQVKSLSVVERKFMSYSEIYHPSVGGVGVGRGVQRDGCHFSHTVHQLYSCRSLLRLGGKGSSEDFMLKWFELQLYFLICSLQRDIESLCERNS